MRTFFPEGWYSVLGPEIFEKLTNKITVIDHTDALIYGELNGVRFSISSNLSLMFFDKNISISELNDVLLKVENIIGDLINGFRYKLNDDVIKYRLESILSKYNKISNPDFLTENDNECINEILLLLS